MPIKIHGNVISDSEVGISVPAEGDIDVASNSISACRRAIEVRDTVGLAESLGFQKGTPKEIILRLLEAASSDQPQVQIETEARASGVAAWLTGAADLTTVIQGVVSLAQSGLLAAAVKLLSGS